MTKDVKILSEFYKLVIQGRMDGGSDLELSSNTLREQYCTFRERVSYPALIRLSIPMDLFELVVK